MIRVLIVAFVLFVPAIAAADARAYIGSVEGVAILERDRALQPAAVGTPIFTGDRVRTERGQVDVIFPDGAALVIGPYSEVEFTTPFRARVIAGSVEHRPADQHWSQWYPAPYGYVWHPAIAPMRRHHGRPTPDFRATYHYRPPTPGFRTTYDPQPLSPPAPAPSSPPPGSAVPPAAPSGLIVIVPGMGGGSAVLGTLGPGTTP